MKVYRCDRCGKHYLEGGITLKKHSDSVLPDVKPFKCDLCSDCKYEFYKWMKGVKTNEHIRTEIEEK